MPLSPFMKELQDSGKVRFDIMNCQALRSWLCRNFLGPDEFEIWKELWILVGGKSDDLTEQNYRAGINRGMMNFNKKEPDNFKEILNTYYS